MKRLVLIKQFYSVDVAHLYEHLYCAAVSNLLMENGIFQYVDYSLVGKTSKPGIVTIDVELYSKYAISFIAQLQSLKLSLKKSDIHNAMTQILAEEEKPLFVTDSKLLKKELKLLDDMKWLTLDDMGVVDTKHMVDTDGSFYVAVGEPQPAQMMTVSIELDGNFSNKHRDLIPLFYELSRIVIDNLQITLPSRFGIYSYKDEYKQTAHSTARLNHFRVARNTPVAVSSHIVLESVLQISGAIKTAKAFERYFKVLQDISFFDQPNLMPNFEHIYEDTQILVGGEGWISISTVENLTLLMSNMRVELAYDNETISASLF